MGINVLLVVWIILLFIIGIIIKIILKYEIFIYCWIKGKIFVFVFRVVNRGLIVVKFIIIKIIFISRDKIKLLVVSCLILLRLWWDELVLLFFLIVLEI